MSDVCAVYVGDHAFIVITFAGFVLSFLLGHIFGAADGWQKGWDDRGKK